MVFEVFDRCFDDAFVSIDYGDIHFFVKDDGGCSIKEKYMKSRAFNFSSFLRMDDIWNNHTHK